MAMSTQEGMRTKQADQRHDGNSAFPFNPVFNADGLLGTHRAMLDANQAISDKWSRSAQDFISSTFELTAQIACCKSPAGALDAYGDWMQANFKRHMADVEEVMGIWQGAVKATLANGRADGS